MTKSGNLPRQCPLFPGMPIKLTENIAVELGLSNSTSGIIKDVVYDPRESIQNTKQHILQYPPLCVIVTMQKSNCPQLQELAPQDVPIFSTSKSFQYKFPGMKKPVTIRRRQLPLCTCLCIYIIQIPGTDVTSCCGGYGYPSKNASERHQFCICTSF